MIQGKESMPSPETRTPIADVSVVAANYNNAAYLDDYFQSWIQSTVQPAELIFVDDGSTDESLEVAKRYKDDLPNLVILELGTNRGFGNALNAGIDRASCKYIMRVDPDDVLISDRLAVQLELLESEDVDVVGSNAIIFHSSTRRIIGTTNFPLTHSDIARTIRKGEHGVLHPTVIARAELFKNHPYNQGCVPAEDYDIFARMLRSGARFANIKRPLLRYRVHQKSASNVLPFSTIRKTYSLRDSIFGTKTPGWYILAYYAHIKCYRKYLFSELAAAKIFYLGLASALRPDKAFRRLLRAVRSDGRSLT